MIVDQTVTYLEMTSPHQLIPGRIPTAAVTLQSVDVTELPLIRSTNDRIAAPHHWSNLEWSDQRWLDTLSSPTSRSWIARIDGNVAGLAELELESGNTVEISTFGLVPEFVGRGCGGHFLTLVTRLAWEIAGIHRVWLHTSSLDHPHALANYLSRGFRPFRVEYRPREIRTEDGPSPGATRLPRHPCPPQISS